MRLRWQRFVPHALAQSRGIAALLGLGVAGVALEALLPWPLKLVVDHALAQRPLPALVAWLGALPGAQRPAGLLAWLALGVLVIFLAVQAVRLLKGIVQATVTARMQYALGAEVFDRLHALSLAYHRCARKGDLVRRVTTDTLCLPNLLTGVMLPATTAALSLLVLFAIMWRLHPTLAMVAAGVALPMGALMRMLAPRMTERAFAHQEAEGEVWATAEQSLTALPVVQAFGREEHEETRFRGAASRSIRAYLRTISTQIWFKVGIDASEAAGIALIMLLGGLYVLNGSLSLGTLIVFLSYLHTLYAPLSVLAHLAPNSASAAASARRVTEVLDAPGVLDEHPHARPLPAQPSGGRGHVRLEGVVFGYEPGKPVLRGVDFDARPGETVALVGATGAGKSTLVSLVPRLFDPWDGRVLIDGQDVRMTTLESVRASVSFVLQEPFLLPLSIAENIAYGRPGATPAQIETAARAANAHLFVDRLAQGYDTVIGERGITLSGGERQRLAIARALLKDAPILILDEPTGALDAQTEQQVLEGLRRLTAGRTTIVIAHRLSTLRDADRVVVLQDGQVAACGTHAALLSASGLYRTLFVGQLEPGPVAPATIRAGA